MDNLKNFIRSKGLILSCIFVFLIAFFIRVAAIDFKQDLFIDEVYTTQIANYNPYFEGVAVPLQAGMQETGYNIKQKILALEPSFKDTISDIVNLHTYTRDTPHSNFYYTLYRLWFNGWGEFNLKKFIIHGASLNLIFFAGSFLYLYKILKRLFQNDKVLVPFGLFTTFMSTAAITNTTFIRPYALQEMFFLILTYTTIKYWDYIADKEHKYKIIDVFILGLTIALTLLTGYYSVALIGLYTLLLLYRTIKLKNYDALRFFITTMCATGLIVFLLYPGICFVLFSYRAKEAYNAFSQINNIGILVKYTPIIILRYLFSIPLIVTIIYYLRKCKFRENTNKYISLASILMFIGIIWSIFILFLAPYKNIRYIMPATALVMLIFPLIASRLKVKKWFITIVSAILILNIFIAISEFIGLNFRKYIPIPPKIEFLSNIEKDNFIFLENKDLPVYIIQYGMQSPGALFTQFEDKQIYYISNETPQNIPYAHFYVIRRTGDTQFPQKKIPGNYILINTKSFKYDHFTCDEFIKF